MHNEHSHTEENPMEHHAHIEALLFYKGEPLKKKDLQIILAITDTELEEAIDVLKDRLAHGGLCLIEHDEKISLGTQPAASDLIADITKDELTKDLGKAGLETLSIILYKGPVSRRKIDYIRGVNSSFIIRNLLVRGLIERAHDATHRSYVYTPSTDLLMHLGITHIEELPDYSQIKEELDSFEKSEERVKSD